MSPFPGRATMRAAFKPLARSAASKLGSRASVFSITSTRQADATTVRTLPVSPTYTNVEVRLVQITNEQAQETFGQNSIVEFEGHMVRSIPVKVDDVFEVTWGEFKGQKLRVDKALNRDLSDAYLLGFVTWKGK